MRGHRQATEALLSCMIVTLRSPRAPSRPRNSTVYLTFVPKASLEDAGPVLAARPAWFRPMTLSNTSQKIVPRAVCQALERHAVDIVHPMQRGFVPGRSLVDCILDLETEMMVGSAVGAPRLATVLFDFSAAFPSVEWDWIERALAEQGLPQ